jgi:hypothetical protein
MVVLTSVPRTDTQDTPKANILPPIFVVKSSKKKAAIDPQQIPDPEKKTNPFLRWFRREAPDPAPTVLRSPSPQTLDAEDTPPKGPGVFVPLNLRGGGGEDMEDEQEELSPEEKKVAPALYVPLPSLFPPRVARGAHAAL